MGTNKTDHYISLPQLFDNIDNTLEEYAQLRTEIIKYEERLFKFKMMLDTKIIETTFFLEKYIETQSRDIDNK